MASDKEYKKVRIALAFMNTVFLGIGLGLYIYDRNHIKNIKFDGGK